MNQIERIYRQHIDDLYAYGMHLGFEENLVKDCIQNIFEKLLLKPKLKIENTKAYLFKSVRNELLTEFKKSNKNLSIELAKHKMPFDIQVSIEEVLLEKETKTLLKNKVEAVLKDLSPRQREIIYFRYTLEYDYDMISEIMGISVASSRNLVLKALNHFRKNGLNFFAFTFFI
ncbi:RNA polymerase sigma factor [Ochrovirga pacifica]|uniref:RNA polymerase sigma factor n=1 Tax=Ochrovirga pacifica TaxID=1042376 RepID=UPI000255879C|nr:sigma-70 family RNA polymerase sigma factor [Ochrovirga pacifica]